MPLSRVRDRERKRMERVNVQPISNLNTVRVVQPKLEELRQLIRSIENKPVIPIYNPDIHRPGDRVLMKSPYSKKMIEVVIPELDADGNAMPT